MTPPANGRCPHCRRPVTWCETRRGKNIPLDPRPDPAGVFVPFRNRAWLPDDLRELGEPWAGFADAGAHLPHPRTCPLWPRPDPAKRHGAAQGHLACMCCGTVDATVRHCDDRVDRCRDCRQSEVDGAENIPGDIPGGIG